MSASDPRPCAFVCGLAAEPGDVYCAGCRSGIERQADIDRMTGQRDVQPLLTPHAGGGIPLWAARKLYDRAHEVFSDAADSL